MIFQFIRCNNRGVMNLLQVTLLLVCVHCSYQETQRHKPEQGIFPFDLTGASKAYATKTLYNASSISIKVETMSKECKSKKQVNFQWVAIGTYCKGLLSSPNISDFLRAECLKNPTICTLNKAGKYVTGNTSLECGTVTTIKFIEDWVNIVPITEAPPTAAANTEKKQDRKRRDSGSKKEELVDASDDASKPSVSPENTKTSVATPVKAKSPQTSHVVAKTKFMGEYMVMVGLEREMDESIDDFHLQVTIEMKRTGDSGHLSAHEYPLLNFYMAMCIVYVLYAVGWLIMSACNYHDLLRVQFWIGGVILLGLIEKAVHYSEYLTVDITGISETGTEKFAEIVSALKRAVARMLVIIVSLGFGIVKPRLGPMLHRVIGIGVLYFIIAVMEAMIRIDVYVEASRKAWMVMYIPLAVIDWVICWWVFMSLLQTMKTLRLRRNTVKLSLYRHFSNTIVFCVLASIGMMLWSIYYHEQGCVSDFSNEWFETACWPILFSVILLVIMILWRPNVNNQRYAYSPMIDGNDSDLDDAEEPMLGSGATENMKMRGTKKNYVRSDIDKTEEDLKWIEENIPQTVADAAIPALMDSDEEVMTTKYEMSKME